MGFVDTNRIGGLTLATALAIFTAQLYPHEPKKYIPVLSELTCWALVLAFFKYLPRHGLGTRKDVHFVLPGYQSWYVSAGIAVTTILRSSGDLEWIAVRSNPQLTRIVLTHADSHPLPCFSSPGDTFRYVPGFRDHALFALDYSRYVPGVRF